MKKLMFGTLLCISLFSIKAYSGLNGALVLLSLMMPSTFTQEEKTKAQEIVKNDPPPTTTTFTPEEQKLADIIGKK